jgi:hypothetical protein
MRKNLISWQWQIYPAGHRNRQNLIVHVITAPLFMLATVALISSPFISWWLAPAGLAVMVLVMAAQGRTHAMEASPPVPFDGPIDVVTRILAEQWITFPRFVLTGHFAAAWRASAAQARSTVA